MSDADLRRAHKHCGSNRGELAASELCGCFYCLAVFPSSEITQWIGGGEDSALCPYCVIDSVIGSASGFWPTAEFLTRMKGHWFGPASG